MKRLLFGAGLLGATMLTGFLAGAGTEPSRPVIRLQRSGTAMRTKTRSAVTAGDRVRPLSAAPLPAAGAPGRTGDVVSAQKSKGDLPEASDLVARMRRHLPDLSASQEQAIRRYEAEHGKAHREQLEQSAFAVTAMLTRGPQLQREAVERMRAVRAERREFFASVLGTTQYERWRIMETTGGRDIQEVLRNLQDPTPERKK